MMKNVCFTGTERKALNKVIESFGVNTRIVTKTDTKGAEYDRFFDDFDGSTAPVSEGLSWIKAKTGSKPLSEAGLTDKEAKCVKKLFEAYT